MTGITIDGRIPPEFTVNLNVDRKGNITGIASTIPVLKQDIEPYLIKKSNEFSHDGLKFKKVSEENGLWRRIIVRYNLVVDPK